MWWSLATWDPQIYGGTLPQLEQLEKYCRPGAPKFAPLKSFDEFCFQEVFSVGGTCGTFPVFPQVGVQAYLALHDRSRVVNDPSGTCASYDTVRWLRINKNSHIITGYNNWLILYG
jgi:hypothetical protein